MNFSKKKETYLYRHRYPLAGLALAFEGFTPETQGRLENIAKKLGAEIDSDSEYKLAEEAYFFLQENVSRDDLFNVKFLWAHFDDIEKKPNIENFWFSSSEACCWVAKNVLQSTSCKNYFHDKVCCHACAAGLDLKTNTSPKNTTETSMGTIVNNDKIVAEPVRAKTVTPDKEVLENGCAIDKSTRENRKKRKKILDISSDEDSDREVPSSKPGVCNKLALKNKRDRESDSTTTEPIVKRTRLLNISDDSDEEAPRVKSAVDPKFGLKNKQALEGNCNSNDKSNRATTNDKNSDSNSPIESEEEMEEVRKEEEEEKLRRLDVSLRRTAKKIFNTHSKYRFWERLPLPENAYKPPGSRSAKSRKEGGAHKGPHFKDNEMRLMIAYLCVKKRISEGTQRSVWRQFRNDGYLTHRTEESLRNNFVKKILNRIYDFGLPSDIREEFLQLRT